MGTERAFVESDSLQERDGWELERQSLDLLGYSAPMSLHDQSVTDAAGEVAKPSSLSKLNPHIWSPEVRAMLRDEALVRAVERLCGDNLVIWRSRFFWKGEGSGEIAWHHDKHFHTAQADTIRLSDTGAHYSAFLALSEVGARNGLLEVIPGTHAGSALLPLDESPKHKRANDKHLLTAIPSALFESRRSVPVAKGSFFVFHSSLLHRSLPYIEGPPRMGLAVRFARASVDVPVEQAKEEDIVAFPLTDD